MPSPLASVRGAGGARRGGAVGGAGACVRRGGGRRWRPRRVRFCRHWRGSSGERGGPRWACRWSFIGGVIGVSGRRRWRVCEGCGMNGTSGDGTGLVGVQSPRLGFFGRFLPSLLCFRDAAGRPPEIAHNLVAGKLCTNEGSGRSRTAHHHDGDFCICTKLRQL